MKGRQEADLKINRKTMELLREKPKILTDYYYYMGNKTELTKKNYLQIIFDFFDFVNYDNDVEMFKSLKPSTISRYLESLKNREDGKKIGNSFLATHYYAVSDFFNFLMLDDYVDRNICKKINPPKVKNEVQPVYMTSEEIRMVTENIKNTANEKFKNRDLCIFMLGCGTGLRVSSISEINIEDVDLDNNSVVVTEKGNKTRTCYFGDKIHDLIEKWLDDRKNILNGEEIDPLFITVRKTRIGNRMIANLIEKYTKFLGKHITPHKMRHSCGMNLYENTNDIYLVKEVLGHKNVQNTMIYAHVSEEKKQQAAKALDNLI